MTTEKVLVKKHQNKIKESTFDRVFNIVNITLLILGIVLVAFPLLSYFSRAFNDGNFNDEIILFPVKWSLKSFEYVLAGEGAAKFWRSFLNSVIITVFVTVVSNLVEAMAAYPLSKEDCPFKGSIMMYFVITMLFSAGIIPSYLLMHMFGLLDNIWSVMLISISNVANLLYFKTFFEGLPSDIEDAAQIDGANELQMFFLIVVPMSLPVIGSCCFFTIVGTWNSYGGAMMYISASATEAHPLAYYIYLLLTSMESSIDKNNHWLMSNMKNVQAAAMLASIVPILCIYPYVIQYIRGGLTIGSVKG